MLNKFAMTVLTLSLSGATAHAATFTVSLTGTDAGFTQSQFDFSGFHFDEFSQSLTGLNATNAITVSQGDMINSTVTFDGPYTIPTAPVRTDILQYLTGSSFPSGNTGVTGTFTFFNGATQVAQFNYGSSTSDQLSSFAAVFSPGNPAFTFDSFTNDFTITMLGAPATLDGSAFTYALVSRAVPEPATWALMLAGFAMVGGAMRRRQNVRVTYA